MRKIYTGGCLLLVLLLLQACSSTKLVTRWSDPAWKGEKLHKVLVIGLFKDDLMRRHFEDEFITELIARGRQAEASYVFMPDLQKYKDENQLKAVVDKAGADAVLITSLKDVEDRKTYVAPRMEYAPAMGGVYGYYGYYMQTMTPVYTPGYTRSDKVVQLETRVFTVKDRKMIWAGVTESFNPSSSGNVIRELAATVVADMKKSGFIP
ncbi:hypothetical protein [Thiolapillus brandeum]|uniref:DUF4136 domain-containing protein n=1 Tax=Thiolapillus brandeum TaxID=1076588 RepID=A0A7U6JK55_9GAMM|nr:hypothetical protein [Thiolapillus brandeum]BAO45265.1 conserved hypothetical protein [Thiolapillus brandeum]